MSTKQETFEKAAKNYIENTMKFSFNSLETKTHANRMLKCVEFGAKWQQERMYSEEDLLSAFEAGMMFIGEDKGSFKEWLEKYKNNNE